MLFNSEEFIFVFLPIVLVGYYLIRQFSPWTAVSFLTFSSLIFYSYWNILFLPPLIVSLCVNYLLSLLIDRTHSKIWLTVAIIFNLVLLGFFKYFNFFASNVAKISGNNFTAIDIILPIAISFYTFQNIAYLVDIYKRKAPAGKIRDYILFISFFLT